MDKREDANNLLDTRYWMLDTGCWVMHILNGHQVICFVAICFFDDVFPSGYVIEGGLWVIVYVIIPCCDVGWGDCFDLDTHFELGHPSTICRSYRASRPARLALRSIAGRFTQVTPQ